MNLGLDFAGGALIVAGLGTVIGMLARGDTGLVGLRDEDRQTKLAVRRAIREGGTRDPQIDDIAQRVIRQTPRQRWVPYLYVFVLILTLLPLIGGADADQILWHSLQAAVWLSAMVVTLLNRRRLANYRGLTRTF